MISFAASVLIAEAANVGNESVAEVPSKAISDLLNSTSIDSIVVKQGNQLFQKMSQKSLK